MESLLVINSIMEVSFFADDIVFLSSNKISTLEKILLKLANKWARNNEMPFGINKWASLVVRGEVSKFLNNNNDLNLFYFFKIKSYPKTNGYTYFGVPFSNDLRTETDHTENKIIKVKKKKTFHSIKGFL